MVVGLSVSTVCHRVHCGEHVLPFVLEADMKLPAVVAGSFYPSRVSELSAFLEQFQKNLSPIALKGTPVGLLLPHAGYPYSGETAALGYRSVGDHFPTVIVAGPSHYVSFQGAAVFAGEAVKTPHGEIAVDVEAARILMSHHPSLREIPQTWTREHSVEVHFPLIHSFLPSAKVVPIVMGQNDERDMGILAAALSLLRKEKDFLFVASSDLSHFPDYETAVKKDGEFLKAVLTGDPEAVAKADHKIMTEGLDGMDCTHCGREPLQTLLRYAKAQGAKHIQQLRYCNSGDVTGDKARVVGYGAVAFCK
jgi:AmmeMemoRadiSam system protein B